eukprot:CAMPEP_0198250496 /NCGR_PEP_ID=MMETSP1447-20131203/1668_1 /TAXON_ID=420782 /ORGANISM="Chaetoceros dichaeta, Strain CCMP1751" /LENGTH=665 /DNA_ID=CAMNT_0043935343 /DNA_START=26 /DNA_END=2023 /DNA_ORIENTATION=-
MASELEIPTLNNNSNNNNNNNNDEDDDYHNAITGSGPSGGSGGRNTTSNSNGVVPNDGANNGTTTSQDPQNLSEPTKKSGIGGASANLVNSIVGAGIIGIPYAFRQSGLLAGILLLLLVAYLTDKSLRVIVGLASFHPLLHNRNVHTFEDLASYPFGDLGSKFILLNMFVLAYGAMVAYLLIIKDTIPSILGIGLEDTYFERNGIMFATSILIMVPLAMQRDMASLSITSLFSVIADLLLVLFIASFAPIAQTVADNGGLATVLANDAFNPTLFIGLGILSTAMACQHSAFIVSGSLENKTQRRWAIVTGNSIVISAILCLILGVTGYLGFLGETQGDVLNNFSVDLPVAKLARALLAITMFCTYPMESFVARHVLIALFHHGNMDGTDASNYNANRSPEGGGYFCFNRRQTWTWVIYILCLIPALLVDDIGPVLSITGSVGGGSISYLAPGLIYLGVNGDAFLAFASSLLQGRRVVTNGGGGGGADDGLPIAGDARQIMNDGGGGGGGTATLELPVEGTRVVSTVVPEDVSSKPMWWYLMGFPLWCAIAASGRTNMRRKFLEEDGEAAALVTNGNGGGGTNGDYQSHSTPPLSPNNVIASEGEGGDTELMVPNRGDYCMAVFFIIFGAVAIVAGLTSNIYIIIKGDGGEDDGSGGDDEVQYYGN